nr:MAG TPA: hypothetical protein [Caudoviricetes sp.]
MRKASLVRRCFLFFCAIIYLQQASLGCSKD